MGNIAAKHGIDHTFGHCQLTESAHRLFCLLGSLFDDVVAHQSGVNRAKPQTVRTRVTGTSRWANRGFESVRNIAANNHSGLKSKQHILPYVYWYQCEFNWRHGMVTRIIGVIYVLARDVIDLFLPP